MCFTKVYFGGALMSLIKKIVVSVLSISLIASSFAIGLPTNQSSLPFVSAAEASSVDSFADRLVALHGYLNEEEKQAIFAAREKLDNLTTGDWEGILTSEVITQIDNKTTSGKAIAIVNGIASIIFDEQANFKSNIDQFRIDYASDFDTIFGSEITVDNMLAFFAAFEQELLEWVAISLVLETETTFDAVVNQAIDATKSKTQFSDFEGALYNGIGIGVDGLLGIKDRLNVKIDPNNEARNALVMGVTREKGGSIVGDSSLTVNTSKNYGYQIQHSGLTISPKVQWVSSNTTVANFTDSTLTASQVGTTTIRAVVFGDVVIDQLTVTVSSAGSGPGPGPIVPAVPVVPEEGTVIVDNSKVTIFKTEDGKLSINVPAGSFLKDGAKIKIKVATEEETKKVTDAVKVSGHQFGKLTFSSSLIDFGLEDDTTITGLNNKAAFRLVVDTTQFSKEDLEKLSLWRIVASNDGVSSNNTTQTVVDKQATVTAASADETSSEVTYELEYVTSNYVNGELVAKIDKFGQYVVALNDKTFADQPSNDVAFAKASVEVLGSKGIINGRVDGTFDYKGQISRVEFTSLLVRLLDLKSSGSALDFEDVNSNAWYYDELVAAVEAELIAGHHDNTVKPYDSITRQEMAVIAARALKVAGLTSDIDTSVELSRFNDMNTIDKWAADEVAQAAAHGLILGNTQGEYKPHDTANRASAAVIIKRFFDQLFN